MAITGGHEEAVAGLSFGCPYAEAVFSEAGVRLVNDDLASLLLDEHGGTYVLRVEGLKVMAAPGARAGSAVRLEVALPEGGQTAARVEAFAGRQRLALTPGSPPELTLRPHLTACHVPGLNLFVYAEDCQLELRPGSGQTLEITATGAFKNRRVPCREPDVVIHLTGPEMARLLSCLLSLARS
jgi:hypothetical protein